MPNVVAPLALNVVNAPVLADAAPIAVPSILPPLMSTEASVERPVTPSVVPNVVAPLALNVVNAPVLADAAPIGVPSIAPPLMSAPEVINPPVKVDKPLTSSVFVNVVAPFAANVVNAPVLRVVAPIGVLSSDVALVAASVVAPAFNVPPITVLPVAPATVNLFVPGAPSETVILPPFLIVSPPAVEVTPPVVATKPVPAVTVVPALTLPADDILPVVVVILPLVAVILLLAVISFVALTFKPWTVAPAVTFPIVAVILPVVAVIPVPAVIVVPAFT